MNPYAPQGLMYDPYANMLGDLYQAMGRGDDAAEWRERAAGG